MRTATTWKVTVSTKEESILFSYTERQALEGCLSPWNQSADCLVQSVFWVSEWVWVIFSRRLHRSWELFSSLSLQNQFPSRWLQLSSSMFTLTDYKSHLTCPQSKVYNPDDSEKLCFDKLPKFIINSHRKRVTLQVPSPQGTHAHTLYQLPIRQRLLKYEPTTLNYRRWK